MLRDWGRHNPQFVWCSDNFVLANTKKVDLPKMRCKHQIFKQPACNPDFVRNKLFGDQNIFAGLSAKWSINDLVEKRLVHMTRFLFLFFFSFSIFNSSNGSNTSLKSIFGSTFDVRQTIGLSSKSFIVILMALWSGLIPFWMRRRIQYIYIYINLLHLIFQCADRVSHLAQIVALHGVFFPAFCNR